MKLARATLNGGAGMIVHVVDREQRTCPAFRKWEALCGRLPGGGVTRMGQRRSRWRNVGLCATDSPVINCPKCLARLAAMGVDPEKVPAEKETRR